MKYLLHYRGALALALVSSILASVFVGGAVSLLNDLVTALSSQAQVTSVAAISPSEAETGQQASAGPIGAIRQRAERWTAPVRHWLLAKGYIRVPLAIVVLYFFKGVFSFLGVYGLRRVGLKTVARLRQEIYRRAISQSDAFYRRHSTGEMYSRILVDVARLQDLLGNEIAQAMQSVPLIVVLLTYAFFVSWPITLVCLTVIPAFAWAAGWLGRKIKKSARRSQERSAELTALTEETLLARRVVQAFDAVDYECRRFARSLEQMLRQDLKVARATAATAPVMELIGAILGAGMIVFAGWLIRRGGVSGSDVFVAIVVLFVVFTHVRRLGQLNSAIQRALASARRIFEILDSPVEVRDSPQARVMKPFSDRIELRGVGFDYGRGPVLKHVHLVLRAGEVHALVGASGAGKSTLAMLIPRFIDPTEGVVLFDGVDARRLTIRSLRSQIALVTQETHLFDDTIRANIAYGMEGVSMERIEAAAHAAHAAAFIESLPAGYDTPLGSLGSRLSSGQRQRLAIARAFLRDAPILVLDEATSALDADSEAEVQRALENLLRGRTALIIAHRLSTVVRADRIHVLEQGRIIESGSHAELLARKETYARYHALQVLDGGSPPATGGSPGSQSEEQD
ncbi:MAG: ABC transporter ATP-binding protein [Acidobacteriota bacterium]|nr:ABC transporter ATP-binding protein [Acidobacteriota bacterium]